MSELSATKSRAQTSACTNPAHRFLHLAPVPCPDCRGWLDRDGRAMSTDMMLARYPHMISHVQQTPRDQLPDYEPSRADAFWQMNRIAGRLAWTLILILISGLVLAGLIVALTHA